MPVHPNSLANLRPGTSGTKPRYEERKKKRNLTVTDTAWCNAKESIKQTLGVSVSEAIELIGRGEFKIIKNDEID